MMRDVQWVRECTLLVATGERAGEAGVDLSKMKFPALDLSPLRIRFQVQQSNFQSPNHAAIRVYNVARDTIAELRAREYRTVSLSAGYKHSAVGEIFRGEIKQYRIGKESPTETYLDILAADGDFGYTQGTSNFAFTTATPRIVIDQVAADMGMKVRYHPDLTGLDKGWARGKVGFGMSRARLADAVRSVSATWSIQNGVVEVLPLYSYWPGQAVVLNHMNGLIGQAEATAEGIKCTCLLNPKLRIGGLIRLNSNEVNQTIDRSGGPAPFFRYDQYRGLQWQGKVIDGDGFYRALVVEYEGDTHSTDWYSTIVALAVDVTSKKVLAQP